MPAPPPCICAGMKLARLLVSTFPIALFACQAAPAPTPAPATTVAAGEPKAAEKQDAKKDEAKAEAKKQKQKELRNKQRELAAATVEQQVAELDRGVRQLAVEATLVKTAAELARARAEVERFQKDVKPREIAAKQIGLDQSRYRAEHSKDEFGELTAMYEADEFARTTKELVLKRGRRDLEIAERQLAVATQEMAHFVDVSMPERERELRQKLADAELDRKKAEIDAEKAKLEVALAIKKAQDRLADLAEEIAELQAALAKDTP